MKRKTDLLSIGQVAARTGLAVSAIRFYEEVGLVAPQRNAAGHRRFARSSIRRLSFVLFAQRLGYQLDEIKSAARHPPSRQRTHRRRLGTLECRVRP